MTVPPPFASERDFRESFADVELWRPLLVSALQRHDLYDPANVPIAGHNSTYPTFICGEVVVKLFGYSPSAWRQSHAAECAAHDLLAADPDILAPSLLASGRLFDDDEHPWLYLITRRVEGEALWRVNLTTDQMRNVARQLGRQIARVHALPVNGITSDRDLPTIDVTACVAQSSLPPHLVAQVDQYLSRLESFDRVFLNGDVVANHVYVVGGEVTGIIDWGDAMTSDRHYDIIQIFRDTFNCDKSLLRAFLDASDWPESGDFPRQAMSFALFRQAIGLTQHGRMDVFQPIAEQFPLHDIATLDDLADELFAV